MEVITCDFETYYDKDYSLRKMTTEEYIRDPRFQVIGVSTKVNDGPTVWFSGTSAEVIAHLQQFDWENSMLLAQNTKFEGAILSWRCGIHPKALADTMCMSYAIHGPTHSASLANLAIRYCVGTKGHEVLNAQGLRRKDFSPQQLAAYGRYCDNDVELTYNIFMQMMRNGFPMMELKLIDATLRMFTDPVLRLDVPALEQHLEAISTAKAELVSNAQVDKSELMSNPKFAALLEAEGVLPPMKVSPATGKETYAFAKSDDGFKALQEHDNPQVQALVAARLGNKSTLEETRTQRFLGVASRGTLPAPVKYYAAHTGRWGGDDKLNLQNLPSRGANGKKLKKAIIAPAGHVLINGDSSQIEARVLAWLSGQQNVVDAFANDEDVYVQMAARIYNMQEDQIDGGQRFIGKSTILGCGYQMGAPKFQAQMRGMGVEITLQEAKRIIQIYRKSNPKITRLWYDAQDMLKSLVRGDKYLFGRTGVLDIDVEERGIILPSGLLMRYDDLTAARTDRGYDYTYKTRRTRTNIYGGKVIENVCQALARCIVGEQLLKVAERYRVVLTVHDSVVCCVREHEAEEADKYIQECMRFVPAWATGLPLDCETGTAISYGDCD